MENSDIWKTHGKSFETWICSLAYALIGYCDDIILRYSPSLGENTLYCLQVFVSSQVLLRKLLSHDYCFICRLCQDIVLQKAEVAEILFPNIMVNLSGRKNLAFDLHKLISSKVFVLSLSSLLIHFIFCFILLQLHCWFVSISVRLKQVMKGNDNKESVTCFLTLVW